MLEKKTYEMCEEVKDLWKESMKGIVESIDTDCVDEESIKLFVRLNRVMALAIDLSLEQAKELDQMNEKLDKLLAMKEES